MCIAAQAPTLGDRTAEIGERILAGDRPNLPTGGLRLVPRESTNVEDRRGADLTRTEQIARSSDDYRAVPKDVVNRFKRREGDVRIPRVGIDMLRTPRPNETDIPKRK